MQSMLSLMVSLAASAMAATNPCQYSYSTTGGPSWDFTNMKSDVPWTARNGWNASSPQGSSPGGGSSTDLKQWIFEFNICGNIDPLPPACASNEKAKAGAMAVMWANSADGTPECVVLGGNFETLTVPYTFKPFDEDIPTKGYKIHFMGGEVPSSGTCKGAQYNTMMLELGMICDDRPFPPTGQTDQLFILPKHYAGNSTQPGEADCELEIIIGSQAGCPKECPLSANGKVCSGSGICRLDSDAGAARCMCDDGYISEDCGTPAAPMPVGKIVGALFGGIFLGAAVVAVYYYAVHVVGNGGGASAASGAGESGNEGYYEVDDH